MKVSVSIAAFNAAAFVKAAVDSILQQSLRDIEVIVVDDGSTDRTAAFLAEYRDPRLRVVTLPANCGIATAHNVAMACATGDYFAVMDADDVALPDRLRIQAQFLDDHADVHIMGARIIRTQADITTEIDRPQHPLSDGEIKANLLLLNGSALIHPTMMARLSFLRAQHLRYLPPPRGRVGIDHEFWIECVARGAVFRAMPDVVLRKRRHGANVTLFNNDPATAALKSISRAKLLGLYYPDLTGRDIRALAALLDPGNPAMNVIEVCQALVVGEKAHGCEVSYYGESKPHLQAMIAAAMNRYLAPLAGLART
ncbi:glycosyltransferase family 2 protein [Novosphingobium sp.]|uniref:glycosyltransferase family 2 protein n=1 Tax=Novosphingobium sp. TaxID=1874826 RepID=UPI003D0EF629